MAKLLPPGPETNRIISLIEKRLLQLQAEETVREYITFKRITVTSIHYKQTDQPKAGITKETR